MISRLNRIILLNQSFIRMNHDMINLNVCCISKSLKIDFPVNNTIFLNQYIMDRIKHLCHSS